MFNKEVQTNDGENVLSFERDKNHENTMGEKNTVIYMTLEL